MNGKHETVWCIGPQESGQIMSIWTEGVARGVAEKYPETIYFFAELGEVGEEDLKHDNGTLYKVYAVLERNGHTPDQAATVVNDFQNTGILFRECK